MRVRLKGIDIARRRGIRTRMPSPTSSDPEPIPAAPEEPPQGAPGQPAKEAPPGFEGDSTATASEASLAQRLSTPVCVALVVLVWMAFGRAIGNDFVNFDDDAYITMNPFVSHGLNWNGIWWAFTRFYQGNWHPLTWISHMLDCQFFGLAPGFHHLTSICVHAGVTILLFLALRDLTKMFWPSAFAAAIFAVHPLRVESVVWIAERKDVLSGLFFMLTLRAYVRYAQAHPRTWLQYRWVILYLVLGLMCKSMLVTAPLVLLLLDYWPLQRFQTIAKLKGNRTAALSLVLEKVPLLLIVAGACVVTIATQSGSDAVASLASIPLPLRIENIFITYGTYVRQTLYPHGLAIFYPYPDFPYPLPAVVSALLFVGGITLVAWRTRQQQPWLLVGWLWFLGMLVPVIGIVQVGDQARADRYTYLPQIGLILAFTWSAVPLLNRPYLKRLAFAGAAAVLLTAVIATQIQTSYWKDSISLWKREQACTRDTFNSEQNYAVALTLRGRFEEAVHHFKKAIAIEPRLGAYVNLAITLSRLGRTEEANAMFEKVRSSTPKNVQEKFDVIPGAEFLIGKRLLDQGKVADAIPHLKTGAGAYPPHADRWDSLGVAYFRSGDLVNSIACHQKAIALDPADGRLYANLGMALLEAGQANNAVVALTKAVALTPRYAIGTNNLGNALLRVGRRDEAMAAYRRAIELQPDFAEPYANLANTLLQTGHAADAIPKYRKALELKPAYAKAHSNLGLALIQCSQAAAAVPHLERTLELQPNNASALNYLAWIKATSPDPLLRDGKKALSLAQQASATFGETAPVLRSLAAAAAETGDFPTAIRTLEKAISLPSATEAQKAELRAVLEVCRANRPYRDANLVKSAP